MKQVEMKDPPESDTDSSESITDIRRLAPRPLKIHRQGHSKHIPIFETKRDRAWEKQRRRRIMNSDNLDGGFDSSEDSVDGFRSPRLTGRGLTDEDLSELKGSIELGFGFKEEGGQDLCDTLPALDLYFAVNRQYSDSEFGSSLDSTLSYSSASASASASASGSPRSPNIEPWKICSPGDNPQHVKTRLRHWAQAVACSVRQCPSTDCTYCIKE